MEHLYKIFYIYQNVRNIKLYSKLIAVFFTMFLVLCDSFQTI